MRTLTGLVCLILLVQGGFAQSVLWSRLFVPSGSRGCLPQVATVDSQGNLLIAARYIMDAGHYGVAVLKYSPQGDLLWARTISESGQSYNAEAIAAASDSSFYLAITRADRDSLAYVQRWSADGTMLWSAMVNLGEYDVVRRLIVRPNGVEVLHAYGTGWLGYARLLFDGNGTQLAQNLFAPAQTLTWSRAPLGILRLNATISLLMARVPDPDGILQRWDQTLLQWLSDTGTVQQELLLPFYAERSAQASDGTIYLLGTVWESSAQQARLLLMHLAADGTLLWQLPISNAPGDSIPDVLTALGRGWLIAGNAESSSARWTAIVLGDADGNLMGSQSLSGVYRAVAGVHTSANACTLLIAQLTDTERWKPFLQWWRPDGSLMGALALGGLSQADEQPELLIDAPDASLYAISTVNQGSDNTPAVGIQRVQAPPFLTGRIILSDYLPDPAGKTAQFSFQSGQQTDATTTVLQANGQYTVATALSGTASVRVRVPGWLSRRQTLTLAPNTSVNWTLINGDANRDNQIDDADLLMVLFAFGQSGNGLPEDVNGDGAVDDADLLIVLFNFGSAGE